MLDFYIEGLSSFFPSFLFCFFFFCEFMWGEKLN
jgi:hypothetical protein